MTIVCFGDSVTRGISYVHGRLRILKDNYPSLLSKVLEPMGSYTVLNKGVFNDNSTLLVERLDRDVLDVSPDYVLIEIGGNDCNFRWDEVAVHPDDPHEPTVPLQNFLNNIRTIVERVQHAGAVPVLMSILPLDPVRYYERLFETYGKSIAHWIALCGGIEHWHGRYNRALKKLSSSMTVATIDLRTTFKRSADLQVLISDDGIHPTSEGYQVMAEAIARGLMPLLNHSAH